MKIIADTNIYYNLGNGGLPFDAYQDQPLTPTFINIAEFSKTGHLVGKPDLVRDALRKMFRYKGNVIYEPPFIYLAAVYCGYAFDAAKELGPILEMTSRLAKGDQVDPEKLDEFDAWTAPIRAQFEKATDFVNQTTAGIKENIADPKAHKKKDTLQLTMQVVNMFVEQNTNGACSLMDLDLSRSELLIKTMDVFFKRLETTPMKMVPNDWYDLTLLAYLEPGDQYWTKEGKWNQLIKEAGCAAYLFEEFHEAGQVTQAE